MTGEQQEDYTMKHIDFYMIDAFTDTTFGGNAAAVCPLTEWLPDEILLKMSQQHNQSETAFFVTTDSGFELRWFTTQGEINLCGHATLAAAHVIFEHLDYPDTTIHFETRFVGPLTVTRSGEWLTLDFPAWNTESVIPPPLLLETLGITEYKEVRVARDYMVVMENQQQIAADCSSTPGYSRHASAGKNGLHYGARRWGIRFCQSFLLPRRGRCGRPCHRFGT